MTSSRWYPLVWGRTRRTDTWWRVLPAELEQEGWVSDVIAAVYAGGLDLALPRFLLARVHDRWMTGVACRARDLDETMAADEHGRPLFTFVGWTAATADDPALPSLADWEQSSVAWAAPTYRAWVGPDWSEHVSALHGPHEATPESVGWPDTTPGEAEPLVYTPGHLVLVPAADRHALWQSATVTREPFVLVVGWVNRQALEPHLLTHAAVEGIQEPMHVTVSSGGPDLGRATKSEVPIEPSAESVDGGGADGAEEAIPEAVEAGLDHDRSLTRGLRELLSGNLHGRVDKLEKEVVALRDQVAAQRAELDRLSRRDAGEVDETDASDPGPTAAAPSGDQQ